MITAALNELEDHLSSYVEKASDQDVVITSHGRHVAVLTGFADEDDYLEYRLLNDPQFQRIIGRSREDAEEGRVTRLEDLD
uniref:Antitoxin n=1 Tax=Candidatus Kentrum sp. TUN TaxID=2126343 RepID=A0A450ZMT0_9GAMM|nr:MAG: prevent-host-death family protein [Candidatus Kentron sp. TUN]VFK51637.1 MAG: prevent-host-death family protein [Candidatus Kentron sp. TUN]VFK55094.1 MAG: prevent-host-death family protein [Candidatus Kentron sp. TUN]